MAWCGVRTRLVVGLALATALVVAPLEGQPPAPAAAPTVIVVASRCDRAGAPSSLTARALPDGRVRLDVHRFAGWTDGLGFTARLTGEVLRVDADGPFAFDGCARHVTLDVTGLSPGAYSVVLTDDASPARSEPHRVHADVRVRPRP